MFGRSSRKFLENEFLKMSNENERLRAVEKEHNTFEKFIEWLNELCIERNWQLFGIRKIYMSEKDTDYCYVGCVLDSQMSLTPQFIYSYTLYVYSSLKMLEQKAVYTANFEQHIMPPEHGIEKNLKLVDHYIRDAYYERKGIATMCMDVIKDTAKMLRCKTIYGGKAYTPDTPEQRKKLFLFYQKNGFSQGDNNYIEFDMRKYGEK